MLPVDLFYDIHIHYTEQELRNTQRQIQRLEKEVKSSQSVILSETFPRKKYKSGDLDDVTIFDSIHKFINSTDQFYQYIDDTGKVYRDTCKLVKDDLTKDGGVYETLLQMAEEAVNSPDASGMESFAYKMVKPNVGVEYQFYFIEERKGKSKKSQDDKIHQITILQPYDKLEIVTKEIHPFATVNIVLPIKNKGDIRNIAEQLSEFCGTDKRDGFDCHLFVLFQDRKKEDSTSTEMSLEILKEEITFEMQLIKTDHDISTLQNWFTLIEKQLKKDTLVLYINSYSIFNKAFLHRCVLNSFAGRKAYFPVHFQLLSRISLTDVVSRNNKFHISNKNGYWANAQHDTFCAHRNDIEEINILPATIEELIDDFTVQNIDIIRTADPGLLRLWDPDLCSTTKGTSGINCQKDHRFANLR